MATGDETLRFPTKLDPAAIYARLAEIREAAQQAGLADVVAMLKDFETMTPPQIGKAVIGVMGLVAGKPDLQALSKQIQIVGMNLKNLK